MAMRGRKVPKEVTAIFDKYIKNNVRNLKKGQAIEMFQTEFGLEPEQGEIMFATFDKDRNGSMSIWEFQQFYMSMGDSAQQVVAKFKELDADGSGKLDMEEARIGLNDLKTATGRNLEEKEIEFFLKSCVGEDGQIDLGQFTNLLYTLKLAQQVVAKFKELDADGSGKLDMEEARIGLNDLKTATGRNLEEKEIEFFLKSCVGEDGQIDLGQFSNLLYTLKLYKAPAPKK